MDSIILVFATLAAVASHAPTQATQSASAQKEQKKPPSGTCLAPDGWVAAIERQPGGGWACVMRNTKKRTTKAFFYGVRA